MEEVIDVVTADKEDLFAAAILALKDIQASFPRQGERLFQVGADDDVLAAERENLMDSAALDPGVLPDHSPARSHF